MNSFRHSVFTLGQRYYNSNSGSFWSPDPLGASAADPTDLNSWNMYAYAGGDPINFNDPDGTTACGDLNILGTGMTLSQAVTGGGDAALLSDLVWAESDHTWSRQGSQAYYNEQDAVAWAVENRWKILNGYLSVAGVSNPSTLGWGPNGASISQIIGWSGQFSTISGGQLRSDLQDTLNSVLAVFTRDLLRFLRRGSGGVARLESREKPVFIGFQCSFR